MRIVILLLAAVMAFGALSSVAEAVAQAQQAPQDRKSVV